METDSTAASWMIATEPPPEAAIVKPALPYLAGNLGNSARASQLIGGFAANDDPPEIRRGCCRSRTTFPARQAAARSEDRRA